MKNLVAYFNIKRGLMHQTVMVLSTIMMFLMGIDYIPAQTQSPNTFYKKAGTTSWGMTREQVKRSEDWTFIRETKDDVIYLGDYLNLKCAVIYAFEGDKLVQTSFGVVDKLQSQEFFELAKSEMVFKYNSPSIRGNELCWDAINLRTNARLVSGETPILAFIEKDYHKKKQGQPKVSSANLDYVVRKANWGMSPEQVRKSETWKFVSDVEEGNTRSILYSGTLLGYPCSVDYQFKNQELIKIFYIFLSENLPNVNETFEAFTVLLIQKYGQFERLPPLLDVLLSNSSMSKLHTWHTKDNRTTIRIVDIRGSNAGIGIVYSDRRHDEALNKTNKQVTIENPF